MKYLKEADISGEKLTHMTHIEDMLLSGPDAARFAYSTLLSIVSVLRGDTPQSEIRIAVKTDGAPSCVAASSFQGKRFVATKGFFAKDRKIVYTEEDCDRYFGHAPDLAKKMKLLLNLLDEIGIPKDEIWQGDFLYDRDSLKPLTVDGETCISFHPNTIVYAVPLSDPLAARIQDSELGVMWHTRYTGPDFDSLKIDFDIDADALNKTPRAFCMDTYVRSVAGKVNFTLEETKALSSKLSMLKNSIESLEASGILQTIRDNSDLKLYISTFENYEIKSFSTQFAKTSIEYVEDLTRWVAARFDKEIASKKTAKAQEAYKAAKEKAVALILKLKPDLVTLVDAQKLIVEIKEAVIKKMNKLGSFRTLISTLDRGYLPVGQEGFAINDSEGNIHKLVSRLEFSFNNFSKDVVKGWMSDKRSQESTSPSGIVLKEFYEDEFLSIEDPKFKKIFAELWLEHTRKWSSLKNWPKGLDLENRDITHLGKTAIQIEAGGDWQNPVSFSVAIPKKSGKPEVTELYTAIQKTPAVDINRYIKSLKEFQEAIIKPSAAAGAYGNMITPVDEDPSIDILVGDYEPEPHKVDILAGSGDSSSESAAAYNNRGQYAKRHPYGEAADRSVSGVGFTFPKELKAVSDIHFPAQLQGVLNSFGRGVIDDKYRVVIGPIGSSHAGLQKGMLGARRFYFGYSKPLQRVFVVAKNSIDNDFIQQPKSLQIILSNIFDMLRLHVAGGKRLQFYEKNDNVPELQAAVIDKAKQTEEPRALVQALNVLDSLDVRQLEAIVASKAEVPGLRKDLLKELLNSNKFLSNTEYVSLIEKIARDGVLELPAVGKRMNYLEDVQKNTRALASGVGISPEEAVEAVSLLMDNLLEMTKPQSGTSVGKGELLFAMLIKGGSKRVVGDLDIAGEDIEVKGIGARMAGSSQQGGVQSHSSIGMKLREVVKTLVDPAIYERIPALKQSSAFNLNIRGCPALAEILPLLKESNKVNFAEAYVDAMMSMAPQAPKNNRFRSPMISALLEGSIAELYLNYIMFHFDAYQTAAGWKKMLIFDDKKHLMLLLEKPEDLRKAVEDGALKAMPFSFSSVEGKSTAEPQKGWSLYLYEPGGSPDERKAASEQAKTEKLRAQLMDKIRRLSQLIAEKEPTIAKMPPAKKKQAEQVLLRYKSQLEEFKSKLKELMA